MRRRRRTALLAAAGIAAFGAGCGADDFANDPRPPAPVELTAKVDSKRVVVSPTRLDGAPVGAGLANVTISNQTGEPRKLNFIGPTDRSTNPVVANGVLEFKIDLEEGDYSVEVDDPAIKPMDFPVGPERPSAQNDLLLP